MKDYLLRAYYNTTAQIDAFNATTDVKRALREAAIQKGLLTVTTPMGCGGVLILENDPEIRQAVLQWIKDLVPDEEETRPVRKSGSGTVSSHVRGALLAQSLSIPVQDGKLLLGPWQEIIAYDFDRKIGRREILIHVLGE